MASSQPVVFQHHQHGKSKVRVGRVWKNGNEHKIVEWNVQISLISDCEPAFTQGNNQNIVATDTMKNTVYVLAKECKEEVSLEEFGCIVAKHFCSMYPVVTKCKVEAVEKPWERVTIAGQPHEHGFKLGTEKHKVEVEATKSGISKVSSSLEDLSLLKTTQAGFEGFIHDKHTVLPDTRERIVASTLTASWAYSKAPQCYTSTFHAIKETLSSTFFGPTRGGTYSPSVQNTMYQMARAVLERFPEVDSIFLNMPNLHFLPYSLPQIGLKFADDVYLPTSEPHGTIEARLSRAQTVPVRARM